jgi:hypothetical protein
MGLKIMTKSKNRNQKVKGSRLGTREGQAKKIRTDSDHG